MLTMDLREDITNLCRLCALKKEREQLIHASSPFAIEKHLIEQLAALNICVSHENTLPKMVCTECFYKLDSMIRFIEQIENAQYLLQSIIDQTISPLVKKETLPNTTLIEQVQNYIKNEKLSNSTAEDLGGTQTELHKPSFETYVKDEHPKIELINYSVEIPAEFDSKGCNAISDEDRSEDMNTEPLYIRKSKNKTPRNYLRTGVAVKRKKKISKMKNKICTRKKSMNLNNKLITLQDNKIHDAALKLENSATQTKSLNCTRMNAKNEIMAGSITEEEYLINPFLRLEMDAPKISRIESNSILNSSIEEYHIKDESSKNSWGEYLWDCYECNIYFNKSIDLTKHSLLTHRQCVIYKCVDCFKCIPGYRSFLIHVVECHRRYLKYSCDVCYESYEQNQSGYVKLVEHRKKHGMLWHACPNCNLSFGKLALVRKHLQAYAKGIAKKVTRCDKPKSNIIRKPETGWRCDVCDKQLATKTSLQTHYSTHADQRKSYFCEHCGNSFHSEAYVRQHIQVVHEKYKPYKCDNCDVAYYAKNKLITHMLIHSDVRPIACSVCDRKFRTRQQLKNHMIIHTDKMPYPCLLCGKTFRHSGSLKRHHRTHTGETPYECQYCRKTFANWSNYNKHVKRIHKVDTTKRAQPAERDLPS